MYGDQVEPSPEALKNDTARLTEAEPSGEPHSLPLPGELVNIREVQQRRIGDGIVPKAIYDGLYCESHAAKIWRVAQDFLKRDVSHNHSDDHCSGKLLISMWQIVG